MDEKGLKSGTVTLLLTDVEKSTVLWERDKAAMSEAMRRHDEIAGRVIHNFEGVLVKERGEGDSLFAVFQTAESAVGAALQLARAFERETWPTFKPIRARFALHTGDVECRQGDFYGPVVNRCARLRAIAHGGQVLLSQAAADLVRDALPPGAQLIDLGSHRLRDLLREERVFGLRHAEIASEFPPLRSLPTRLNNLPVQLTSFVGRMEELQRIRSLLDQARLLTLTGVGGAGKTRLALHAVAEVAESFRDGVWFVELAGLRDPALIPRVAGDVLGVQESASSPAEALFAFLEDKRTLLVFDNCEHLLPEVAKLVSELLTQAPGLRVLATSRQPLEVKGEQLYQVPPLRHPSTDERALASKLLASDAGRLFFERACLVQPEFAVTPQNAPALTELCRKLDGIPLAIELAAARSRSLSPEQILERISGNLNLLRDTRLLSDPRHRTLRATLDWSFGLLTGSEKLLMSRFSVFRGGWTLDAAEDVCSGDGLPREDVESLSENLVDRSLILAERAAGGRMRYRMLETVREFVKEFATESGDAAETRARHLSFYSALVAESESQAGSRGETVARIDAELDNIRAAFDYAVAQDSLASEALQLATLLHRYWIASGRLDEGRARIMRALEADGEENHALKARALNLAGVLAMMQGALSDAVPLFEQSLELRRAHSDSAGQAATLVNLGMLAWELGEPALAMERFAAGAEIFRQIGNRHFLGMALLNLGCVLTDEKRHEKAIQTLTESIALLEECGDIADRAVAEANLAHACLNSGDFAQAARTMVGALENARETRNALSAHVSLLVAATHCVELGRAHIGARLYGAALKLFEAKGERPTPRRLQQWGEFERSCIGAIGKDAFEEAREEGTKMKLEEALDMALSALSG